MEVDGSRAAGGSSQAGPGGQQSRDQGELWEEDVQLHSLLTRMEVSPNFYPSLDATSGGEEGGFTTGQVELWGRLEERWFWAGGFWIRSFQ